MKNIELRENIGNRLVAGLVDYLIIYSFFFMYTYNFGELNNDGGYTISGLSALVPMLFWSFITIGTEQFFGATIGNLAVGLKPIPVEVLDDNSTLRKISFIQSVKRHVLDPMDMFLFGLVGVLVIKNTLKKQRLGDLWAETVVIEKNKK